MRDRRRGPRSLRQRVRSWTVVFGVVSGLGMLAGTQMHTMAAGSAPPVAFLRTLSRAPGPGPQWRQVLDRYGRFKLHVPPDWTEVAPEGYGESCNLVVGEASPSQGFAANLGVQQQVAEDGFQLRAPMVDEIAGLMESGQESLHYRVTEKAFAKLGTKECIFLAGKFADRGRTLRNVQVRVVHRSLSYLLTFTSLDGSYLSYEPLFARMLRTLVFERPDGSWPDPPPVQQPKGPATLHATPPAAASPLASPTSAPPSPSVSPSPPGAEPPSSVRGAGGAGSRPASPEVSPSSKSH